jgi:hypothetical protein
MYFPHLYALWKYTFMATSTVPKSSFRRDDNMVVGMGEVPAIYVSGGRIAWGLPGGEITYCPEEATAMAEAIDNELIRKGTTPAQLLRKC